MAEHLVGTIKVTDYDDYCDIFFRGEGRSISMRGELIVKVTYEELQDLKLAIDEILTLPEP